MTEWNGIAWDGPATLAEVRCLKRGCRFSRSQSFGAEKEIKNTAKSHAAENLGHKVEVRFGGIWWFLKEAVDAK